MADGRIEKTHNKANTVKCLLQNLEGGWMCVLKLYNTFHFFVYLTLFIIKCSLKNQVINYETGKQSPYCDTEFLIFILLVIQYTTALIIITYISLRLNFLKSQNRVSFKTMMIKHQRKLTSHKGSLHSMYQYINQVSLISIRSFQTFTKTTGSYVNNLTTMVNLKKVGKLNIYELTQKN